MTETWKIYRALDLISRIKKEETHEKYIDRHKAFDIAIESMEKQIPKKPNITKLKYNNEHSCPICGLKLICSDETGYFSGKQHKYCPECGQALKWGEEDE